MALVHHRRRHFPLLALFLSFSLALFVTLKCKQKRESVSSPFTLLKGEGEDVPQLWRHLTHDADIRWFRCLHSKWKLKGRKSNLLLFLLLAISRVMSTISGWPRAFLAFHPAPLVFLIIIIIHHLIHWQTWTFIFLDTQCKVWFLKTFNNLSTLVERRMTCFNLRHVSVSFNKLTHAKKKCLPLGHFERQ